MPTSYQMFVKKHMASISGSPKEKMAKIGKMWRESKEGTNDAGEKPKKTTRKYTRKPKGGELSDDVLSGAGMIGDFFKKAGTAGLNLAKTQGQKLVKTQLEQFKKDPLGYAKNAYSLGKMAVDKVKELKGGELTAAQKKTMKAKHRKFAKLSGGAIPWNWEYLDPSRGISEQLEDYYKQGKVYVNPLGKATLAQVGGDEQTLQYNHRYWDAKDEGQRLLNAVQVDNQRRADEPSAAERIATGLVGSVAEGVTKGAMGGRLNQRRRRTMHGGKALISGAGMGGGGSPGGATFSGAGMSGGNVLISGAGMGGGGSPGGATFSGAGMGAGVDDDCHYEMRSAVGY